MKTKRMTILFVVLALLTLLIVLGSVVFTVQTISVDYVTTIDNLSDIDRQDIVSSSGLTTGKSMFMVNKNSAINSIEKNIPYSKVVNIESVFPNKLVIHMTERVPVMAVATSSEDYLICDKDFKVLEIVENLSAFEIKPIVVTLEQETISDTLGQSLIGSFLSDVYFDKVKELFRHVFSLGYDEHEISATWSSVTYGTLGEDNMNITSYYGNDLVLCKIAIKYKEKVTLGLSVLETYKTQGISDKQIKVYTDNAGKVIASELEEN